MNRNHLNYVLDVLLMLLGLAVLVTGLWLAFVVPRGSGRRGVELWGLARHDWSEVHFWLALALTTAVALHLVLHWAWVHATTARYLGVKTHPHGRAARVSLGVAIGVLLALILGSIAVGRVALTR